MNLIEKDHQTELLTNYFQFPFNKPISYYNAYSCINLINKIQRKYDITDIASTYFYYCYDHLLLIIIGRPRIAIVIAPKTNENLELICSSLKLDQVDRVFVHVPNFGMNRSDFKIIKTYRQVIYDCESMIDYMVYVAFHF